MESAERPSSSWIHRPTNAMPWHIEQDHPECQGFAVVKDEDMEVVGCHRTEAQALDQLAALNIAEADEEDDDIEESLRAGTGPSAIITDIDETLIGKSGENTQLIQLLNESENTVIVITGRLRNQRQATEELLDRLGLEYDELIMSAGGDPNTHKHDAAESLLSRYTIVAAYDDNPDAREAYQSLGIEARAPRSNRDRVLEMLAKITESR
jgi:hypothetical protein